MVSDSRPAVVLRPGVQVQRQRYRGERWFVLQNPFSNQYFRLRLRVRICRPVAPGADGAGGLGGMPPAFPGRSSPARKRSCNCSLSCDFANLLHYERALDTAQLFTRYKQRRQRELTARLLNLMFMRFPLLDPDRFLLDDLAGARLADQPCGRRAVGGGCRPGSESGGRTTGRRCGCRGKGCWLRETCRSFTPGSSSSRPSRIRPRPLLSQIRR